jgi:ABC-2 type transport system ATP-binding protein
MTAIQLSGLSKTYRSGFWMRPFEAVKGIDLTVEQGEAFGFVGPNGAGKTSTIKILAGLQAPTTGDAFINGVSCREPRSRQQLGFLPERPYFYTHLTANEVLRFYGSLFGMKGAVLTDRIQTLLKRVDMTKFADVPLGKYSKGMLQRVGLCQTLLHDPEVILLDEPMSGLDPVGRALVRDIILEERQAGRTVFFCSHVLSDVESICDHVAILIQGEIRKQGTMSELLEGGSNDKVCIFQYHVSNVEQHLDLTTLSQEATATQRLDGLWEIVVPNSEWPSFLQANVEWIHIVEVHTQRQSLEDLLVGEVHRDQVSAEQMGVLA